MFYKISGEILHKDSQFVAIATGGVAFKLLTTITTLSRLGGVGEKAALYTYLYVREDQLDLYGFESAAEESCFKMLLSVSGVGPKAALGILSDMTPERFALAVAADDAISIKKAPGIGPKTAQRIILELKDKVKKENMNGEFLENLSPAVGKGNIGEAMSALQVLGYSSGEAASALSPLKESTPVEELIKAALKRLSSGR